MSIALLLVFEKAILFILLFPVLLGQSLNSFELSVPVRKQKGGKDIL